MLDAEEEDGRLARDARDVATRRDATHATHAAGGGNVNADDNVTPHGAVANGAGAAAAASDREDTSAAYGALLRSELLGDVSPPEAYGITPPPTPSVARYQRASTSYSSPGRNLFRFQSDGVFGPSTPRASESPYSLSPVGAGDGPLGMTLLAPRRTPRKIAQSHQSAFAMMAYGVRAQSSTHSFGSIVALPDVDCTSPLDSPLGIPLR